MRPFRTSRLASSSCRRKEGGLPARTSHSRTASRLRHRHPGALEAGAPWTGCLPTMERTLRRKRSMAKPPPLLRQLAATTQQRRPTTPPTLGHRKSNLSRRHQLLEWVELQRLGRPQPRQARRHSRRTWLQLSRHQLRQPSRRLAPLRRNPVASPPRLPSSRSICASVGACQGLGAALPPEARVCQA